MNKRITSVTVAPPVLSKWQRLANDLGVSRSEALSVLIESAEIVSRPVVSVKVQRDSVVPAAENVG